MAVWFVRAGQESRHAQAFVAAGVMGLGWNGIPGLGNLGGLSRDDIESALDASSLISVPGADANELLAFRDEIHIGDLIVTPDSPCREFVFGTVTGEYEYRDPSPLGDYRHVRPVDWTGRVAWTSLPQHLEDAKWYRRTVRSLDADADEWLALIATTHGPAERAAQARPRPSASRVHSGTDRSTAADRVCAACGLLRSPGLLDASDVCADCL